MPEFEMLASAYASGGWVAAIAAAVVVLVRLYRRPEVQGFLPTQARWSSWPLVARIVVVFVVAFISSVLAAIAGGTAIKAALLGAIPAAIAAIGAHKFTKAVGHAQTAKAIAHNPHYQPSLPRRAIDLVVPLDRKALASMRLPAEK